MKVGITLPQGCDREYLGLDGPTAWARTVDAARQAEALGFESLWLYDHFQVDPPLIDAPVFEPFVELTGPALLDLGPGQAAPLADVELAQVRL